MKSQEKPPPTSDEISLGVLIYEFPSTDRNESERAIRRKLRAKKQGEYDPNRIALLRRFKDSVQTEIMRGAASRYYVGPCGTPNSAGEPYVDVKDFDHARMAADYASQFPSIPKTVIDRFVGFAIFVYHLL